MGNSYEGQEKGIKELRELSPHAKKYLSHHLRNSLHTITSGIETGNLTIAKNAAWHIVKDLERIGC